MEILETQIKNVLTRTTGYLRTVTSHSLQPYRGCTFGNSLCGVGCYVQHNRHLLAGRRWGDFLEVRTNAAESYLENYEREARWARCRAEARGAQPGPPGFSIFCSSATDPFVPQESRFGVTRSVLRAMLDRPPDTLILQTHSHQVADSADLLLELAQRTHLRVHMSIETDRDSFPCLPPHATPLRRRFEACRRLKAAGIFTVVTVSPLLPIDDPDRFFADIAEAAHAVVIDHFIQGDGSPDGSRTWRTPLPAAMQQVLPHSVSLEYRDRMIAVARRYLPGAVGISSAGFAGHYE